MHVVDGLVEVRVNLKEVTNAGASSSYSNLDENGALLFTDNIALWRFDPKDSTRKLIAGGGSMYLSGQLAQAKLLREAAVRGPVCEAEPGVYWVVQSGPSALIRVDVAKDEIKTVLAPRSNNQVPHINGIYEGYQPDAQILGPTGPIISLMGPNGHQLYLYSSDKLMVIDTTVRQNRFDQPSQRSHTASFIIHGPLRLLHLLHTMLVVLFPLLEASMIALLPEE